MSYIFKQATLNHEYKQIHKLNYETFVEEIPQHEANDHFELIDTYHNNNTYLLALKDGDLVGMLAINENRPFSLDKKIGPVEHCLPCPAEYICEIRLLSVKKKYRNGRVFFGLAQLLAQYCLTHQYDTGIISGTIHQLKLYKQIGFTPFANLVGTEEAQYQPMYMTRDSFLASAAGRFAKPTISFLPGPVQNQSELNEAISRPTVSHRHPSFLKRFSKAKKALSELTRSKYTQILLGTGTLANDVIAAQLKILDGKGLILINGEFGERLVNHATRAGLHFKTIHQKYGEPFCYSKLKEDISEFDWIWAVHTETSTGMINDMDSLKILAQHHRAKLCLDCISSIGAIPLNLEDIYLAAGTSGKALGSLSGLSFVFHNHQAKPNQKIPSYLDLGMYDQHSTPFSHSSSLIEGLLHVLEVPSHIRENKLLTNYNELIRCAKQNQLDVLCPDSSRSSFIITIPFPESANSFHIGLCMENHGYLIHYASDYLQKNNWIQLSTLNIHNVSCIEPMMDYLKKFIDYEIKWSDTVTTNT